jgi:hypothetical protein
MTVYVVKRSGEKSEFDPSKVEKALIGAGAGKDVAGKVIAELQEKIYDGITTSKIYGMAFQLLDREDKVSATRYGLKQAILRLGPSGFPFEKFFAALLKEQGYSTKLNQIVKGRCVAHEIDIVAEGPGGRILVECKYHNSQGMYTGLKEAMYTHARLQDVNEGGGGFDSAWLVCNTKVSGDGIKYSECRGMKVTGWHHPAAAGIENMIECEGLYPVTILRSVDDNAKKRLAEANIMLTKILLAVGVEELAARTRLSTQQVELIRSEARELTSSDCTGP